MERILLIEDSPEVQHLIQSTLSDEYEVTIARDASQAQKALKRKRYDIILLDLLLPDRHGLSLCTHLRQFKSTRNTPIIVLSGESDIDTRVSALRLGAEDFIPKPFAPQELRARIEARLRTTKALTDQQLQEEACLLLGDLKIEPAAYRTSRITPQGEEPLNLTPTEFKLLSCLAHHEDRVLSRERLLDIVWGNSVEVVDRVVDVHLSSLRKKIRGSGAVIEAVRNAGYRLRTHSKSS